MIAPSFIITPAPAGQISMDSQQKLVFLGSDIGNINVLHSTTSKYIVAVVSRSSISYHDINHQLLHPFTFQLSSLTYL